MDYEEDTYSAIFNALKHPIRRKILRILQLKLSTYTEIQSQLNIDNGLLNYHLDNMKELIFKNESGFYTLSEFGKAAISLIGKVEEPVRKPPKIFGLKSVQLKAIFLILIVALCSTVGYIVYNQLQPPIVETKIVESKMVSAIVVRLYSVEYDNNDNQSGYIGLLRLIEKNETANQESSSIVEYFIKTQRSLEQGYVVTGIISSGIPNSVFTIYNAYPFLASFVFNGDNIEFSYLELSSILPHPFISFGLSNLGEKTITSIRCAINGTLLPFVFGVSTDSPIGPSQEWGGSVYTSWIDPSQGEMGVKPISGQMYLIHFDIGYSDGTVKSVERLVKAAGFGNIVSVMGDYGVDSLTIELFQEKWSEFILSLSFRMIWRKNVTSMEVTIDGKPVMSYQFDPNHDWVWVGSMKIPFNAYANGLYNVTLKLFAYDGETYETSQLVRSQNLHT